jgi:dTDP-glucose 4,6-dehydratase
VYNIGGDTPRRNLEIARIVLDHLGLPESRIELVRDRPGHDWRYCVDDSRIRAELGWAPRRGFEEGLRDTIDGYASRP